MPKYVEDGIADIAICGENVLEEYDSDVEKKLLLDFASCRLSLAVPKQVEYSGVSYFQGKRIATSYPNSLKKYLTKNGVEADVHLISGSVEIAPNIGLADGICDLVSTGSTLLKNGLKEVEIMLKSQSCLVANRQLNGEKASILEQLMFRLNSVLKAKDNKYVLLNAPNENLEKITSLLPGMRSPSVLPLAEPGWSSVHSVMNENDFWNTIASLKEAGAEGILIIPIEKMMA